MKLQLQYYFYIEVIFIIQLFKEFSKDNIYKSKVNNFYYKKVYSGFMIGWVQWTNLET